MGAPFPRWSDSVLRVALIGLALVVVGVPSLSMAWMRSPLHTDTDKPLEQPVEFDHRHHVRDDGIDCGYCHHDAFRAPTAGVPATELCMGCHGQIWSQSPLLEPVRQSYFSDQPIRWRRVHDLPDFVFFDHSAHVRRGVGCESCHGRVDTMGRVYAVAPLTMKWCLDCHRDPIAHLRPPEAATVMGWTPPEPQPSYGRRLAAELAIRAPTHCTGCHR